jgi:hypothetical protein
MTPGRGEVVVAEGDPGQAEDEARLSGEFDRQLSEGQWAAVPFRGADGRRQARMVRSFEEVPTDAERVIFFPQAAGGS